MIFEPIARPYFRGPYGEQYFFDDIARHIHEKAPEVLGGNRQNVSAKLVFEDSPPVMLFKLVEQFSGKFLVVNLFYDNLVPGLVKIINTFWINVRKHRSKALLAIDNLTDSVLRFQV